MTRSRRDGCGVAFNSITDEQHDGSGQACSGGAPPAVRGRAVVSGACGQPAGATRVKRKQSGDAISLPGAADGA
eukprot:4784001-Heterocapsa_arctica.AAC.1